MVLKEIFQAYQVLPLGISNQPPFEILQFRTGLTHLGIVKFLGLVRALGTPFHIHGDIGFRHRIGQSGGTAGAFIVDGDAQQVGLGHRLHREMLQQRGLDCGLVGGFGAIDGGRGRYQIVRFGAGACHQPRGELRL